MSSMGMDKSGTFAVSPASTWVKVQGFVARSGYPATVITSHALVIDTVGAGNIRWRGGFGASLGTQQFRVVKNGTTVLGTAVNAGVIGTASGISVVPGDTLELQGFTSQASNPWGTVQPGAAVTFLEWNQTSSNQNLDAAGTIGWNRTADLAHGTFFAAAQTIGWAAGAALSLGGPIGAAQTIGWTTSAELYVGVHETVSAAQTIGWNRTADLLWTPAGAAPPALGSMPETNISIHTADGRTVGVFPCTSQASVTWGREATEVSGCDITIHTQAELELIEDLRQWVHWATVWEDDDPVWTGPLMKIRIRRDQTIITARDPATFMWRTRVPTTRTWVDTAPARVADELWQAMFELHGIRVTPVVLPGITDTFTLNAKADSRYLHQLMNDLQKVGLQWTVFAGRPILGTFPTDPVAELAECDFMVDLERLRDGTAMFNDIRVQGQNWAQTAIAPLAGLHLQQLVSLDDLFGASNIQRATQQYARDSARFRDVIEVPAGATLHPDAPVTMHDLIPGKVVLVHSDNVVQPMRLDQLTVTTTPESREVAVTLVAVENEGEIATLTGGGAPS
ncbi:hypothetical protein [Nocardia fluminea]|uniref:hypothetical protein n=1 Tax=Nocardia fluminea TaxID=134984 RepID=UPI00364806D1